MKRREAHEERVHEVFVSFVVVASCPFVVAQEPLPRFRSGANLVTVDAYFSKDGKPVTDLKPDEIEILEDNRPQAIENFRIVQPAGQGTRARNPIRRASREIERGGRRSRGARLRGVL